MFVASATMGSSLSTASLLRGTAMPLPLIGEFSSLMDSSVAAGQLGVIKVRVKPQSDWLRRNLLILSFPSNNERVFVFPFGSCVGSLAGGLVLVARGVVATRLQGRCQEAACQQLALFVLWACPCCPLPPCCPCRPMASKLGPNLLDVYVQIPLWAHHGFREA